MLALILLVITPLSIEEIVKRRALQKELAGKDMPARQENGAAPECQKRVYMSSCQ